MLDSIVKFVDSNSYFISSEGPVVSLYTVAASASAAVVTTIAKASLTAGDYIIIPTPTTTYYAWMDITGHATTDDPEANGTGIRVAISAATTAANVATILASAVTGVSGLTAAVNTDGDVEIDVDTAGECEPISDFSCGFTLSSVIGGADANGLLKSGTPNSDTSIVELRDIAYAASTDTLTTLAKVKSRVAIDGTNPETGYTTTFSYEAIADTNWVLG